MQGVKRPVVAETNISLSIMEILHIKSYAKTSSVASSREKCVRSIYLYDNRLL